MFPWILRDVIGHTFHAGVWNNSGGTDSISPKKLQSDSRSFRHQSKKSKKSIEVLIITV